MSYKDFRDNYETFTEEVDDCKKSPSIDDYHYNGQADLYHADVMNMFLNDNDHLKRVGVNKFAFLLNKCFYKINY